MKTKIEPRPDRVTAAEFALKAYVAVTNPELAADTNESVSSMQRIAESVDVTEAPEDAICSLIVDLMHYCECEHIDWTQEILSRSSDHFNSEQIRRMER